MFEGASAFNHPLGDWRVDNVRNMEHMFYVAISFNQPLGSWRVDNATNVNAMFRGSAFDHWKDLGDSKLRSQRPCCAIS